MAWFAWAVLRILDFWCLTQDLDLVISFFPRKVFLYRSHTESLMGGEAFSIATHIYLVEWFFLTNPPVDAVIGDHYLGEGDAPLRKRAASKNIRARARFLGVLTERAEPR